MPREQRPNSRRAETSLYGPVKRYLETLGFRVKGEVCGCDLVALRGDEPLMVVVGELKLSFSLDLVLQAVDRTAACDEVGLQLVQQLADACAIRVCASSAVFSVSAYSEYHALARSKFCSSPGPGGPAEIADAVRGSLMNTVSGSEILLWVDRRNSRS